MGSSAVPIESGNSSGTVVVGDVVVVEVVDDGLTELDGATVVLVGASVVVIGGRVVVTDVSALPVLLQAPATIAIATKLTLRVFQNPISTFVGISRR